MCITIAVVNEKGGVGKTTTTVSLGGAYARAGRPTLLIDLDPQASLTRGLLGSLETDRLPPCATAAAVFDGGYVPPARLVAATAFDGLYLLPGSRSLKPLNRLEPGAYGARQYALRELVAELAGRFDRVLIDTPPNLEFLAAAALAAADYVVTPLQAEDYGAQGVQFVRAAVAAARAAANPRLVLLGLVRTMYQKRAAVHVAYTEAIRAAHPGLLLDAVLPHATHFREAVIARKPVGHYKPRCAAAAAAAAVVAEIEARIGRPALAALKEVA